jgi:MoxR-like ATPase
MKNTADKASVLPRSEAEQALAVRQGVARLIDNIKSVIYIDTRKLEYIIAAQIAGGHVMLADTHGVGKTSLARALAGSIRWVEDETSPDAGDAFSAAPAD